MSTQGRFACKVNQAEHTICRIDQTDNIDSVNQGNAILLQTERNRRGRADQVGQGIGVVKAGVAGGRDDISQVIGWQAEVGHMLKVAISMLQMHSIVLQCTRTRS